MFLLRRLSLVLSTTISSDTRAARELTSRLHAPYTRQVEVDAVFFACMEKCI